MNSSAALRMLACSFAAATLFATRASADPRPVTVADANAGKALYLQECAGCHGERGDGQGPAAEHVEPKPRQFTAEPFKLRTTATGQPPATADILRTIERGIPGTAMPSFRFLSPDDRKKIAAYVLKLADVLDEPEPEAVQVDAKSAPPATPQTIAHGKELFEDAGCAKCHGPTGKGDGPTANEMKDSKGRPVRPRDFTDGRFRGGGDRADLYTRLATGMDGTPMPAYADVLEPADRWAVVDFVLTLQAPPAPKPLPADAIAAGREVAKKYSCGGCHVLDDGQGGSVGPDFRVSGQKLDSAWVKRFLLDPRAVGKIYPWRPYRMPALGLSPEEADVMARYIAKIGNRPDGPLVKPDPATFPAEKVSAGQLTFVVTCAQCHALGKVIETPVAAQQGPDLIRVGDRVDFEWAKRWITDPKKIDPKTRMTIPQLQPSQIDEVRMFVWKSSLGAASDTRSGASSSSTSDAVASR
ncbi:MAG TPA: c-type cytochrome [Candidatus Binatia bacterium]|nr:c-type cytochrome [Candidatus Binatia bacterium]